MKLHAPATLRNREVIAEVLTPLMPTTGTIAEVASGSGEHIAFLAPLFPAVGFQPSDIDPRSRASIDAHAAESGATNIAKAIMLDALAPSWEISDLDGLLNINMIHISPWKACTGLLAKAATAIKPSGFLFLYGPYFRDGVTTAPSNSSFDRSLRSRNPTWGIRDLADVEREAQSRGLMLEAVTEMPANNVSLVFRRA